MDRTERPWGWYEEVFSETPNYKCKRLYVNPDQRFSLQYHEFRNEYWTVVQGDGKVILGDDEKNLKIGDFVYVPRNTNHRLIAGDTGITILEIQIGEVCSEDDIVRLEDDFERV
jgi:mannose-6-phosphate isomerase-like protein (cupin superfamily)